MATIYDASAFISEKWNTEAVIDPTTLAQNLFTTAEYDLAPVGAKTAHILVAGSFVANDMSSNTVVDQAGSETDVELVMDQAKHVSTLVRDLDELQSEQGVRQRLAMIGGMNKALMKKIDSHFVTTLAAITPATGHSIDNSTQADWIDLDATGDTPAQAMDKIEALMRRANTVLTRADVVTSDRTYLLVPEFKELALATDKWASNLYVGMPNLIEGEFGKAFGNRIVERMDSTLMSYVAVNGQVPAHTIVRGYCYQKSVLACGIQQQPRYQAQYALENLSWRVVADDVYGMKEAVNACLVKMSFYFVGDPFKIAP